MSHAATAWAWQQQDLPAPTKLVLLALADYTNEHGISYPSTTRLSSQTGLSKRTITRHLQALQEAGMITITPRTRPDGSHTSNYYQLHLADLSPPPVTLSPPPCQSDTPPLSESHPPPEPVRRTGKKNHIGTSPKKDKADSEWDFWAQVPLPPNVPRDTWTAWVEHRRSKGKRLTERGVQLVLQELTKAQQQASALIEQGIMNDWTGLKASWMRPETSSPRRARWDVTGGDAQNRDHPDWKPVPGQHPIVDHGLNTRRNTLHDQARGILENWGDDEA